MHRRGLPSGGGHAAARQHAAVRCADGAGDGNRCDTGGSADRRTIAAVASAKPTHLVGYATVVGQLARASLAGCFDIRPVRVSTNSDRSSTKTAGHSEGMGRAGHNLWGSTEIGVQAVGCARDEGLHVCEDEVVLERVDETGAPVGPDEPAARTLATGLANRTFPFIRYDLGDQVDWLPGRALRKRFSRVPTSAGGVTMTSIRTCTIPASVFRHVLGTDPPRLRVPGASDCPRGRPFSPWAARWRRLTSAWSLRCAGTGCPTPRSRSASSTDFNATTDRETEPLRSAPLG